MFFGKGVPIALVFVAVGAQHGDAARLTTAETITVANNVQENKTLHRINCGGPEVADTSGAVWAADYGFNTGSARKMLANKTIDRSHLLPLMYTTERWDNKALPNLIYRLPVPTDKQYTVMLHFSEIDTRDCLPGDRTFQVEIEGRVVVKDLDVVTESGGLHRPLSREFNVECTDGELLIELVPKKRKPSISGIEVWELKQ